MSAVTAFLEPRETTYGPTRGSARWPLRATVRPIETGRPTAETPTLSGAWCSCCRRVVVVAASSAAVKRLTSPVTRVVSMRSSAATPTRAEMGAAPRPTVSASSRTDSSRSAISCLQKTEAAFPEHNWAPMGSGTQIRSDIVDGLEALRTEHVSVSWASGPGQRFLANAAQIKAIEDAAQDWLIQHYRDDVWTVRDTR